MSKNVFPYDSLVGNKNAALPKGKRKRKRIPLMVSLSGEILSYYEAKSQSRETEEIVAMARREINEWLNNKIRNVAQQMQALQ